MQADFGDLSNEIKLQFFVRVQEIDARLKAVAEKLPRDEPLPELTLWEKLSRRDPRDKRVTEMFLNLLYTGDTIDSALENLEAMWD